MPLDPRLLAVAIHELPESVRAIQFAFLELYPDEVEPPQEDVMTALNHAHQAQVDRSPLWLSAHPEPFGY